jgi:hypothetical protein
MTYLFELNHPKHFHQFKHIVSLLSADNNVIIIAREKEVLFNLLDENYVEYIKFSHSKSGSILKKIAYHLIMLRKLLVVVYKHRPGFFLSKASVSTIFVKVFFPKCKTVIFPDSEVVWLTNKIVRRFANKIFSPENFTKNFGNKQISVPGIFENAYLSPKNNSIEPLDLSLYGYPTKKKTVLLRFVGWSANHDVNQFGFTENQKKRLVQLFSKYDFNIIISTESVLPNELEIYKNPIPASKMHSLLKVCQFYVGDSQTMATEAALLGAKSFRYNSFVGVNDMSNFKFLEKKGLLLNYNNFEELMESIEFEIEGKTFRFKDSNNYWNECKDQNSFILNHLISEK